MTYSNNSTYTGYYKENTQLYTVKQTNKKSEGSDLQSVNTSGYFEIKLILGTNKF